MLHIFIGKRKRVILISSNNNRHTCAFVCKHCDINISHNSRRCLAWSLTSRHSWLFSYARTLTSLEWRQQRTYYYLEFKICLIYAIIFIKSIKHIIQTLGILGDELCIP